MFEIRINQFSDPLERNGGTIGVPNLGKEHLGRRLHFLQLFLNICMNFDLMVEKGKQTNVKLNLRQDFRNISKEVVALHIQKH